MFGEAAIPFERIAELIGASDYGKRRSRVGNFPEVLGAMPASLMAKEITTPGKGRMRALFVSAGNPVLSVPNGEELAAAMRGLDLSVAIDIYMSETAGQADYVLPATTFLEREDLPLPFLALFTKPFINMTEAVVEPAGEARQEWEIIEDVAKRIGIVPQSVLVARWIGKAGLKLTPRQLDGSAAPRRPRGRSLRPAPRRSQPRQARRLAPRRRPRRTTSAPASSRARSATPTSASASARSRSPTRSGGWPPATARTSATRCA